MSRSSKVAAGWARDVVATNEHPCSIGLARPGIRHRAHMTHAHHIRLAGRGARSRTCSIMDMIVSFAAQASIGSDGDGATGMCDPAAAITCAVVIVIFGAAKISWEKLSQLAVNWFTAVAEFASSPGAVATFLDARAGAADRHLQATAPSRAAARELWAAKSLPGMAESCPLPIMAMIS